MEQLLREEKSVPFRPAINDSPDATASLQILHPEIPAAEFRKSQSRQREAILAERQRAEVCLRPSGVRGILYRKGERSVAVFQIDDKLHSLISYLDVSHFIIWWTDYSNKV